MELYWQSLLRDVPLHEFRADTSQRDVLAAVAELNRFVDYNAPQVNAVTSAALFRGTALYLDKADASGRTGKYVTLPGALDGPYLSQFLLRDAWLGTQSLSARIRTAQAGSDFQTEYDEWLTVQNGGDSGKKTRLTQRRVTRHRA